MSQLMECGICHKEKECTPFTSNLFMCSECLERQKEFEQSILDTAQERVDAQKLIIESRQIDNGIKIQTDIFNAKTIAIHELKVAIDSDDSITNKHLTLAQVLDERFKHLTDILFSKRTEIVDGENEQRAIQTYYNDLAKKLRTEEREKIKLQDSQYKPAEPKLTQPKAIKTKKYDKAAINAASTASKIPAQLIQMTCVARNVEPLEAVRILQAAMSDKS